MLCHFLRICYNIKNSKGEESALKTTIRKYTSFFICVLLFVCALTACGSAGSTNTPGETNAGTKSDEQTEAVAWPALSEGDSAPDFTANLADGNTFTLSEQQGKVVLLNFWATWCGPCVREMPAFEKLHTEYGDDAVILAVNCLEDTDTVDAFITENGYSFPIAYDTDGSVNMRYPTQGIPYTLIIDGEGIIQKIYVGAADADTQYQEYKGAIDEITE